jgi:hypothetical protein
MNLLLLAVFQFVLEYCCSMLFLSFLILLLCCFFPIYHLGLSLLLLNYVAWSLLCLLLVRICF